MAFIQTTAAHRPAQGSRLAAFGAKTSASLFCYAGFALSLGFAAAIVLGFVR